MMSSTTQKSKRIFKKAAIAAIWIILWQIAALLLNQEILLPSPLSALKALTELLKTLRFYLAVVLSLTRIAAGYILGVIAGVLGAVLSYRYKLFSELFTPVIKVIKAVPVASFIVLAFVWFKSSQLPIFISFLMVLPMVWEAVYIGLENIDVKYLEMAKVFRLKPLKTFFEVKVPLIIPNFLSTALTAIGFAWKSGIAAEVICRPSSSLGNMLQESRLYIEMPEVFALTAVVTLLSVLFEKAIKHLLRGYKYDKTE
ncbi:MAG: ABC transporter permease [Acutalibacteraceae bacterium]|jgi:NitT/TauT family transport system permease protein